MNDEDEEDVDAMELRARAERLSDRKGVVVPEPITEESVQEAEDLVESFQQSATDAVAAGLSRARLPKPKTIEELARAVEVLDRWTREVDAFDGDIVAMRTGEDRNPSARAIAAALRDLYDAMLAGTIDLTTDLEPWLVARIVTLQDEATKARAEKRAATKAAKVAAGQPSAPRRRSARARRSSEEEDESSALPWISVAVLLALFVIFMVITLGSSP